MDAPGGGGQAPQYDVMRDGRFLINTVLDDRVAAPITLIQHWRPEGKEGPPTPTVTSLVS